jgi:hypothetical protein
MVQITGVSWHPIYSSFDASVSWSILWGPHYACFCFVLSFTFCMFLVFVLFGTRLPPLIEVTGMSWSRIALFNNSVHGYDDV